MNRTLEQLSKEPPAKKMLISNVPKMALGKNTQVYMAPADFI